MSKLLCFGLGYSARVIAARWQQRGWSVSGTSRSAEGLARLYAASYGGHVFDGTGLSPGLATALDEATHVVVSVPPGQGPDPVLAHCRMALAAAPNLRWVGYLSTIGVYGDHHGAWIDEKTTPKPVSQRSQHRLAAEQAWGVFSEQTGRQVQIFRLAGIYGPGRSAIDAVNAGTARRLVKTGQVFNRIHVDDIANVIDAAITTASPASIFNVTDDEPAPPQDVVAFAASLLGRAPPPEQDFETAELTPMARSFYGENKRVRNDRIKSALNVSLAYPTYREGLAAIASATQ